MKNRIKFVAYSPGGNITALVEMGEYKNLPQIAREIMEEYKTIEQVGFLSEPKLPGSDFHLEMMGGEFCGNAARSAALHMAKLKNKLELNFTVSGFALPLSAMVRESEVTLLLPGKFLKKLQKLAFGWLVDFEGIRFLVTKQQLTKAKIQEVIKAHKNSSPAVGVIILNVKSGKNNITPWVWVSATNSLLQETACSSGSLAAAAILHLTAAKQNSYSIIQPSGSSYAITLIGRPGHIDEFVISGAVDLFPHP